MRLIVFALLALVGPAVSGAVAATVTCPDLSAAVQVAACPSEAMTNPKGV